MGSLKVLIEPGYRKVTMTLIALIGSILLEKYGGGLSGDLKEVILSILGIFVGGNVLSKMTHAVENVKVAKVQQQDVDVKTVTVDAYDGPTETSTPERDPLIQDIIDHVNKLDNAAGAEIKSLKEANTAIIEKITETNTAVKDVSDRLDVQVKNVSSILNIINGMRNGQQQA